MRNLLPKKTFHKLPCAVRLPAAAATPARKRSRLCYQSFTGSRMVIAGRWIGSYCIVHFTRHGEGVLFFYFIVFPLLAGGCVLIFFLWPALSVIISVPFSVGAAVCSLTFVRFSFQRRMCECRASYGSFLHSPHGGYRTSSCSLFLFDFFIMALGERKDQLQLTKSFRFALGRNRTHTLAYTFRLFYTLISLFMGPRTIVKDRGNPLHSPFCTHYLTFSLNNHSNVLRQQQRPGPGGTK